MRLSNFARAGHFIRIVEIFPPVVPSSSSSSPSSSYTHPSAQPQSEEQQGRGNQETTTAQKFDLEASFERLVHGMERTEQLADAFSLPELKDSNRIHLNSIGIAGELKRRTGNAVIPTITLRDANKQSLLGSISFAMFAGIGNIMIVRGDPYSENGSSSSSSSREPKNVFDIARVSELIETTRRLESRISLDQPLCILSPINLARTGEESYLKTIAAREVAGVDIFVAEQMFEDVETYLDRVEAVRKFGIQRPIVHTIFPFKDYADALNCMQKFSWHVSESELAKLKKEGPIYGLEMARERCRGLFHHRDKIQGVSVSTRGNPGVARYILS